jgi:tetratricopeptide (TPR) repeat protein
MRTSLFIPLVWLWCGAVAWSADFDTANQLYEQGKYAEAGAAYQELVGAGHWSANLFYNLGNAHQRLGAGGEALLNYERALALDPGHPEAAANRKLVRSQTGAVPWPESWIDRLFPGNWVDAFTIVGALAGWAAIFALAAICFTPRREKVGLWCGAIAAGVVAAYAGAAVWWGGQDRDLAIVTAKTTEARLAPAESSAAATILPAGSEVRVLSERGDWTYCALPVQSRGWISSKALERVRLGKL